MRAITTASRLPMFFLRVNAAMLTEYGLKKGRRIWLILTLITLAGLGTFVVHQHFAITVIETELVASNAVASTFQQPAANGVNTSERLKRVPINNNVTSPKPQTSPSAAGVPSDLTPAPMFENMLKESTKLHKVAQVPRTQARHPEQKVPSTSLGMAATELSAVPTPPFHAGTANTAFYRSRNGAEGIGIAKYSCPSE